MTWTRIAYPLDWVELENIVKANPNYRLVYRRARCQHGKTLSACCHNCENGCGTDSANYANIGDVALENGALLIAVSDDAETVAYVPKRFERPTEPQLLNTIVRGYRGVAHDKA